MKKIDLMLKVLFLVAFANVSYGQGGELAGGLTCEEAVPINVGTGYMTPNDGDHPGDATVVHDNWYSFIAPCDGELIVSQSAYPTNQRGDKRIHSGVCGSLVVEHTSTWTTANTPPVTMVAGEEYFIEINDDWQANVASASFDLLYENPACPQVTSLDGFTPSFDVANLAWFAGGSETDWVVTYGPTGFDPEASGSSVAVTGTPSVTITGLEELTCYDYYVQAVCGGGVTSCFFEGPFTFCTPAICPDPTSPNVSGITNLDAMLNWSPGSSETMWDVQWGPEGFTLGSGTSIDATPFTTVDLTGMLEADMCYDWYVRAVCEVDLGSGLETVNSLWVGPIEFCTNKNCLDPSDLSVISAPGLTATVTWTENNAPAATEWNIQYGEPGFSLGSGVTITNVSSNPFTIPGLEGDTEYCFYVQTVCGEGEDSLSNWVGPVCFTTDVFCTAPSGLFASGSSGTDADISWTEGGTATSWTIIYGEEGSDLLTDGIVEEVTGMPGVSVTGLDAGETYCFIARANCGTTMDLDSASIWAGPFCWTQPEDCATPFAVEAINITNTAAFINYTSPGAETFELSWGPPCFAPGDADEVDAVASTPDDPFYIDGLEESTPYWVYVRATCGVDSVSAWTLPLLFGTDINNDDPCDAEMLVLDGPQILRHNFEATTLPGEDVLTPELIADCFASDGWCSGDPLDRSVWFQFVAPASGQVVVSTFDESDCITNNRTEVAVYSTGDCNIFDNYVLEAANTQAPGDGGFGSEVTACGLTPGQTYYVLVNPISAIQADVHFGIQLNSVEEVTAGLGLNPTVCEGSTVDLFDAIAGFSGTEGQWFNPVVGPGNELPNLITIPGGSFSFFYVIDNGCFADTVMSTISTEAPANAGGDGAFVTCNTFGIILSDHIVGPSDGGGIWSYVGDDVLDSISLSGGFFDPLGNDPGEYEFLYTVANEFCPADSATVIITLNDCLGIDDEELNNLVVYPNPVVDVLTVQDIAINGNAVIEVLDIEGRVIYSDQVSNIVGNYTIDMSEIETGVYFVKVTGENTVQKVRVVKQ